MGEGFMLWVIGLLVVCVVGAGAALYRSEQVDRRVAVLADDQAEVSRQLVYVQQQLKEVEDARDELVSFMSAMRASEDLNQQAIARVYKALDANGFDGFKGE